MSADREQPDDDELKFHHREEVTVEDNRERRTVRYHDGTVRIDLREEGLDGMKYGNIRWRSEGEEVGVPLDRETWGKPSGHPRGWLRFDRHQR